MKRPIIIALAIFLAVNVIAVIIIYNYILSNTPERLFEKAMENANECMQEENYTEAIGHYEEALEIYDDTTAAYRGTLEAYQKIREQEKLVEYYEMVLEEIRNYDEENISRDLSDIVIIYCMSDKVYPGNHSKIAAILEEGYFLTNQNTTIAQMYNAHTITMEELIALNNEFNDYVSRMSQKMMIESEGLHTQALLESYDDSYSMEYLFVINAPLITQNEYQRMVDSGIISGDFDTVIEHYDNLLYEVNAINLIYALYEDEVGESLELNYLIDLKSYFEDNLASEICSQYSENYIEYYTTLVDVVNESEDIEYEGAGRNARYEEITVKHAYQYSSIIIVYCYDFISNENFTKTLQDYGTEVNFMTDYLNSKYSD